VAHRYSLGASRLQVAARENCNVANSVTHALAGWRQYRSQFHCSDGTRLGRVCGARSAVTVGYYPVGGKSCSVLSGSVVAIGRVSGFEKF
jgi:hypothetical protein